MRAEGWPRPVTLSGEKQEDEDRRRCEGKQMSPALWRCGSSIFSCAPAEACPHLEFTSGVAFNQTRLTSLQQLWLWADLMPTLDDRTEDFPHRSPLLLKQKHLNGPKVMLKVEQTMTSKRQEFVLSPLLKPEFQADTVLCWGDLLFLWSNKSQN